VAAPAQATPTVTQLFGFPGVDGQDPDYLIQASDGDLYGTTTIGGGTVFKITPAGQFALLLKCTWAGLLSCAQQAGIHARTPKIGARETQRPGLRP